VREWIHFSEAGLGLGERLLLSSLLCFSLLLSISYFLKGKEGRKDIKYCLLSFRRMAGWMYGWRRKVPLSGQGKWVDGRRKS